METNPDLIPLPQTFPGKCLAPLAEALRGRMSDPFYVAHCAVTLECWVLAQFGTSPGAASWPRAQSSPPRETDDAQEREWAARQLEQVRPMGGSDEGGPQRYEAPALMATNWRRIAVIVLELIRQGLESI
jgi:hypothetical protein